MSCDPELPLQEQYLPVCLIVSKEYDHENGWHNFHQCQVDIPFHRIYANKNIDSVIVENHRDILRVQDWLYNQGLNMVVYHDPEWFLEMDNETKPINVNSFGPLHGE